MSTSSKILVVEDEMDIANLLQIHLDELNYDVHVLSDGQSALDSCETESWDLCILDVVLPKVNGLEVCRRLRKRSCDLPIIFLSSRSSLMDRVIGLQAGADDYVTKPFGIQEIEARVEAVLRRSAMSTASQKEAGGYTETELIAGDIEIDLLGRTVQRKGDPIRLTTKEYDLLVFFCQHPKQTFSRMELLEEVWGYTHKCYEHTVNTHINRLRAKLQCGTKDGKDYISTVWGCGYRFDSSFQ